MIPDEIRQYIDHWLNAEFSSGTMLMAEIPLSGGSINATFHLKTTSDSFFLKYNDAAKYPGMFRQEARGLQMLKNAGCIGIPEVLLTAETGTYAFILLEFIAGRIPRENFYRVFGQQLSALHAHSAATFGLDHDNYIGSLHQSNRISDNWIDFLVERRLQPLLENAVNERNLNMQDARLFENIYARLPGIFPPEPPALLHGDLWSGNFMTGNDGFPCIFDPAVYFGHREMDIAMTRLFGGFAPEFYEAYNDTLPLEPGWEKRIPIHQLYPLLVHVNLFGGSYASQIRSVIGRF